MLNWLGVLNPTKKNNDDDDELIDGIWRFLDVTKNEVLCEVESENESKSTNAGDTDGDTDGDSDCDSCFSFNGRRFSSADDLQKYVNINMVAEAHSDNVGDVDSIQHQTHNKLVKGEYSLNGVRFASSGKLHKYFNSRLSTNNDSGSSNCCSDDEQFEKVTDMDGYLYDFSKNKTQDLSPKINVSGGGVIGNSNKKETSSWLYWR